MKMICLIVGCVGLAAGQGLAQTAPAEVRQDQESYEAGTTAASVAFQAKMFYRVFGIDMQVDGVIPKMLNTRNPLQLFSPFAPMEYGDGYDNVSIDPVTGEAAGIRFFHIEF